MSAEATPGHPLAGVLDAIYLGCIWVAGIAIALMSLIIPVGVFMRYVVGFGAQWPEPIAILLMMIFTFVGVDTYSLAKGKHATMWSPMTVWTPEERALVKEARRLARLHRSR